MKKLQQFYVFKITTSRLKESNFNIEELTVSQARMNGELIQIGDNQVFRSIRDIKGITFDQEELNKLIKQRDQFKYLPSSDENARLIAEKQKQIDKILFVPDIINVKVDDRKVYKEIFKKGFIVNGIKYLRLMTGSGQSRRSTASFVSIEIMDELNKRLHCGLNIKKINVAKYNAYFGLHMSSTYQVRTPRICLIDDCENYTIPTKVDWIEDVEYTDKNNNKKSKRRIVEREFDFKPNMWDGQGLISPRMAELWREDLELDYLPSSFGIRSAFIKGQVVVFDFHKFAKEVAKTDTITDHYGDTWNIDDIDILLSVSQFKMYSFYSSWSEYEQLHKHHGHYWGVTKVNSRYDNEMSLTNYQYIQTLNLDKEKISELIKPTIDWIEKICNGDKLYTLLFLLGILKENDNIEKIFNKTNSNFIKAVLYNDELLNDPYIKKKIYDSISTRIKETKIGRLWVHGNYQAMISDPYAQAEWAFQKEVKGLLKRDEYYSRFWTDRNVKKVDACRSPMVDFHEHNIISFVNNDKVKEWYKYLRSGIVYHVWGTDTIRHSDSDWDYDIVFTTDNPIIMNGIFKNKNVITYDKVSAPKQSLTKTNILKTDLRSFDSKIGAITNYSTTFITMLANFEKDSVEYNEIIERIKLLRRYIGDSIDQAKGIKMKPFPSEWKKRLYINKEDTEEIRQEKKYHNKLVANKKPYFMIYVYDKLHNEYREYKRKCERTCKEKFGCTLSQLLNKPNKTKQEKYYVSDYYRKMPVIKNNSVMNILCGMVEAIDFKYKRPQNNLNNEIMLELLSDSRIAIDDYKLNKLILLYNKFKKKRHFKYKKDVLKHIDFETGDELEYEKLMNEFYDEIRNEAYSICPNMKELANHLVHIVYLLYPSDSKEFAWSIGIEGILENLKDKSDLNIEMPIPDQNGVEYLGKKYSLRKGLNSF